MGTVFEQLTASPLTRGAVVLAWTSISLTAWATRLDAMSLAFAALMALVVTGVGALGFVWAAWPLARGRARGRRAFR